MKITKKWLKEKGACIEGINWLLAQKEKNAIKIVENLITEKRYKWANWLTVRLLTHKQQIKYAIFAAEQVLDIYEKKYPNDKRPRRAIAAAKKCVINPNDNTAYAAANAASAAYNAATAAANTASAAANAASAAANAADTAAYAANAAGTAAYAADAATYALYEKIIKVAMTNGGLEKWIKEKSLS